MKNAILAQISGLTKEILADNHQRKAQAAHERATQYLAAGKIWEHKQALKRARAEDRLSASFRGMAAKDLAHADGKGGGK
jgi:hypothetical protein